MTRILTLLLLSSLSFSVVGQESPRTIDIVHLTNGEKIKGLITRYEPGSDLEFKDLDGREMTFPEYQVKKVSTKTLKPIRMKSRTSLAAQGVYHTYQAAVLTNTVRSETGGLTGVELSGSVGFRFKSLNEVGLGSGIDFYHTTAGEMVVPIFAEYSRALVRQPVSPILGLRAGYGIGIVNQDQDITDASGGYMLNPIMGWRLSSTDGMNLSIILGVKFQQASFRYVRSSDEFSDVDLTYKRLQVGIKMQF